MRLCRTSSAVEVGSNMGDVKIMVNVRSWSIYNYYHADGTEM